MGRLLALLLLLMPAPESPLDTGRSLTLKADYDAAVTVLGAYRPKDSEYNEHCYLMAANNFALNRKQEAQKWVGLFNDSFQPNGVRRWGVLVAMMDADLKGWEDGNPADIVRDMKLSGGLLDSGRAKGRTQELQKDIVAKLDKLIEEQEGKAGGAAGGKGDGERAIPGQLPGGGGLPVEPAKDSTVMGGAGAGKVDDRKLREVAEQWGTLPPDRRAALVHELTRDLPPRYRPLIDEYFRSLNRQR